MDNNNVQAGLANISTKAEIKASDNMHNQFGGTYNDNRTIIVQGVTHEEMNAYIDAKVYEKIELLKRELESNILPNKLEKLKNDVGVITSYKETISISAIKNDEDLDKILSTVLKERIESEDTDTQNTCSQAISAMKNLTKNHLKIVAFIYLLQSKYLKYNTNTKNFIEFYDKYVANLINIPNKKLSDLGSAVLGNGLAVAYTLGWNVVSFLPNNFYDALDGRYIDNIDIKSKISTLDATCKHLGISSSFLTPVGKCIGYSYLKDVLGLDVIYEDK